MTVAETPSYAAGSASRAAGASPYTASGASSAGSPADSFLSLLFQGGSPGQSVLPDGTSFESDAFGAGTAQTGPADKQALKKATLSSADITSDSDEVRQKRKKTTAGSDASAPAFCMPAADVAKAVFWWLSAPGAQTSATAETASADSNGDAQQSQSLSVPSGEPQAPAGLSSLIQSDAAQPAEADSASSLFADMKTNAAAGAENTISNVTAGNGAASAVSVAELSLKLANSQVVASSVKQMSAVPAAVLSPLSSSASTVATLSSASAPSVASESPAARTISRADNAAAELAARPVALGINQTNAAQNDESSRDSSSPEIPVEAKKKADSGGPQRRDDVNLTGNAQNGVALPSSQSSDATQQESATHEQAPTTTTLQTPVVADDVKSASSSVGAIELQVRTSDDSAVGLRFVERQGHVEIQLKSSDSQTAQALSENLTGLKTSLNETGWDVQARLSPVAQGSQNAVLEQRVRAETEQSGLFPVPRSSEVTTAQTVQSGTSDSARNEDNSHSDRQQSSERDGQQGRHDAGGADSERHEQRSTRGSAAWLESMESDLSSSSMGRALAGVSR